MNDLAPERWQQIDDLFAQALDRPPGERTAFLHATCGENPGLYHEVAALLEHADVAQHVLGESATRYAAPILTDLSNDVAPREELPGDELIGPYRLVREIGRGGMGTVYLAERADGAFEQNVALKLVKRGMDTDEILRRFRHERQILASLQHPHIAQLHDGGVAPDGRPYLVMEYVEGTPIDRYCDTHMLSVERRLRLFEAVCEAVHYAHQNLVVHRDLKPSNILVTENGQVKLLDFGIAKVLSEEADELTRTGMPVMTPAYAAPEQALGTPVTTATDVYALGVVLYELLTGHRPSEGGHSPGTDTRPERPSATIAKPSERHRHDSEIMPEAIGAARGTTVAQLQRQLRGDLDTILLKALRHEPARRYASAEAFLDDLKRHLAGLPVAAQPDTVGYRFRKFVRRHQFGVATVAAFVLLLLGFVMVYTVQVTQERNVARQERDKAEEVAAFLEGLFDASDPFAPERADTLRIRDFLVRGAARVQQELQAQPLVQAQMLHVIGRVYQSLGLYEEAHPLLQHALAIRQRQQPPGHPEIAESLADLGLLQTALGNHQAADSLLQHALLLRRASYRAPHAAIAASLNNLAELRRLQGRFIEAERYHQEALHMVRAVLGEEHPQVATVMSSLAATLERQGEYERAAPFAQDALALRRMLYGSENPSVAIGLNDLALLLQRIGNYEDAEAAIRESLAISTAALGEDHPYVAAMLHRLASILWWKGELEGAEQYHRQSLALRRQLYGNTHIEVAVSLSDLGSVLRDRGNYDASVVAIREAVAIARQVLGDDHADVAIFTGNLASSVQLQGDCTEAERLYQEAIDGIRRTMPEDRQRIPALQRWLGRCLTTQGRYAEAEATLLESYQMLRDVRGAQDKYTRQALAYLIDLYDAWGKPEEAATYRALLGASMS